MEYKFPQNFIWGTATAAHQVEGNNTNSDWWVYEQTKDQEKRTYPLEPSLEGCQSYTRYEEDFDLCKQLNNNGARFSIEWARIEPNEGEFDQEQIEHYRKVLQAAKARGLKTFVTLHHFTNPIWFSNKGGWHGNHAVKLFARYAQRVAQEYDGLIDFYLTINEPQVYTLLGYRGVYDWMKSDIARWPPAKSNLLLAFKAQINFMWAHRRAYKGIKKVHPQAQVGIVNNITWWETDPYETRFIDLLATKVLNFIGRDYFLYPVKSCLDFVAVNYYFTNRIKNLKIVNPNDYVSDLGWWINPAGISKILEYLKGFNLPIYITENGIADADDKFRKSFIKEHLLAVIKAIGNGANVKGYFYWSLLDNYEWHQGYWPKFGLVEIDRYNNYARKPRQSFYYYADICKNNSIKDD